MNKATHFLAKATVRIVQKLHDIYGKINLYKLRGELKHLGSNALIEGPSNIMNPQCMSIGDNFIARSGLNLRAYTGWDDMVFTPEVVIGNSVHFAAGVTINCLNRIEIGDNSGIGVGSKLMDHAHGLPGYEDIDEIVMKRVLTSKGGIVIRENVMVGANVVILAGVEIGRNSIIGSNSVVNRSIPPNSIAAGVPAKVIRTISVPAAPVA